jgi:hypothetical protein
MKTRYFLSSAMITAVVLTLLSCTDLHEKIIDQTTGQEFITKDNLLSIIAPSFNNFNQLWWHLRVWGFQEITTDEIFFPTRGINWEDGGKWKESYFHTWTPQHQYVTDTWNELATGMARANYSLLLLDDFPDSLQNLGYYKAELNFLKYFYMYCFMDLYGKVPYREYTETNYSLKPKIFDRNSAFNFITTGVKKLRSDLPNKDDVPYGQPNKDAATMLLAKLYLNQEVYTGVKGYDSCLVYVNELINSGRYGLADDYFNIFAYDNYKNADKADNEAILVSVQSDLENMNMEFTMCWLEVTFHYNQLKHPVWGGGNWNGYCLTKSYFDNLIAHTDTATDVRWRDSRIYKYGGIYLGFNYGLQYNPDGSVVYDNSGNQLNFTPEVSFFNTPDYEGVRVLKYIPEPPPFTPQNGRYENDFIVWRLSDAILMRAECNLRNGNAAIALDDVNTIRRKRKTFEYTSIDLDKLLSERALELYTEGHRRQDLIRFGKFLEPKDNKPDPSPSTSLVLPIPQVAIDAVADESVLSQNPGY